MSAYKRVVAVLCVALSLSLPCAAAETLLTNGGFESGTVGQVPSGWSAYTIRSTVCVSEDEQYTGIRALKIETDEPDVSRSYAFCYQKVSGITAGASYTASVYIKSPTATPVMMKLQLYNGTSNEGELNATRYDTGNAWTLYTYTFEIPQGCDSFELYVRLLSSGTVYFDDATLKITKEPDVFWLEAEETFFYTEWGTGSAELRLNPYYTQYGVGNSVMFRLLDNTAQVIKRFTTVGTDGTASFSFDLSRMAVSGRKYILEATLYDAAGDPVAMQTREVFRYNRPRSMTARGTLCKNGKPFVPVYMSGVGDAALFAQLAAQGVNTVNVSYYQVERFYDAAVENGLSIIPLLYLDMTPAGSATNAVRTKEIVEKYKNDPNILGWKIMDEPVMHKCTRADLINSYKIIRDIDTLHPVMASECLWVDYAECLEYVDVLMPDSYPAGNSVPTVYMENMMQKAVAAAKGRRGVMPYLQTFLYDGYYPTAAETVNMCTQCVTAGVSGFGFYRYSDSFGTNTMADTGLMGAIGDFCATVLQPLADRCILENGTGVVRDESDTASWYAWTAADGTYLSVRSKVTTAVPTLEIPLSFVTEHCKAELVSSSFGSITAISPGSITVSLAAGGSLLYKLHTTGIRIYRGIMELTTLSTGGVSARCDDGSKVALAVYTNQNGAKELTALHISQTNTLTIQLDSVDGISEVSAFTYQELKNIIAKKTIKNKE